MKLKDRILLVDDDGIPIPIGRKDKPLNMKFCCKWCGTIKMISITQSHKVYCNRKCQKLSYDLKASSS